MKSRKPLDWIGSSKKDLLELPEEIRRLIGHSLHLAQIEQADDDTKPLKGFGSANVREIVSNDSDGTYRTVYTVEFKEIIYVLHAFKKKSKTGIETPKQEIELIKNRLKTAKHMYKEWKKNES
jgi:phage-related protein